MVHNHTITIKGPAAAAAGLSGHLLRDLMDVLVQGAEQSLRFAIEGRSAATGTPPTWLRAAADFDMIDLSKSPRGRTFKLEARPMLESLPDRFNQSDLFDDLDPRQSPLELFELALEHALAGHDDSAAFDHGLLKTCAQFRNVLGAGLETVEIKNGHTIVVDGPSVEQAVRLSKVEFRSRKVRLAGQLETISYSDCRFMLRLENGARIAGTARDLGAEMLRSAFGRKVTVTGTADFRPSGSLLRLNAESVDEATPNDLQIFASIPRPLLGPAVVERERERGGFAALLGQWPGDESIEELMEQMKELS